MQASGFITQHSVLVQTHLEKHNQFLKRLGSSLMYTFFRIRTAKIYPETHEEVLHSKVNPFRTGDKYMVQSQNAYPARGRNFSFFSVRF